MADDTEATRAIAHDLNNLVTIVSMGCELLRRRFGEGDPARALVDDVAGAATRAGELTRRLLELSARASLPDVAPVIDGSSPSAALGSAPKPPEPAPPDEVAMGGTSTPPDGAPPDDLSSGSSRA